MRLPTALSHCLALLVVGAGALSATRVTGSVSLALPGAGHSEAVLVVAFSPDGKHLASGSGDTTVRFYDLNIELPAAQGKGHKQCAHAPRPRP